MTDAWAPQVNGVVVTLANTVIWLRRWGHAVHVLSPEGFRTLPMPTYPETFDWGEDLGVVRFL